MQRIGVLGVVLVAACGAPTISIEDYPSAHLDVGCGFLVRCGVTTSIESCRQTRAAVRFPADLLAAVDAGIVRWHGEAAEECLDRLEQVSCDRTSESYRHFSCDPLLTGTLSDGQSCALHGECISGECWTESCTDACCIGYCVGNTPPAVVAIGEVCGISECEAGAWCENRLCVPLRGEGEACTYELNGECMYGLACIDKVCTPPIESAASCTIASECRMVGEQCSPRGMCGPLGQIGDLCISGNHCASHLVCDVGSHCAPAPRIGEACGAYSYECFDAGAFCDAATRVCTLPKPDGAACTYRHDCQSGNCFEGACVSCTSD